LEPLFQNGLCLGCAAVPPAGRGLREEHAEVLGDIDTLGVAR
jgi:hypothetical protein